MTSSRRISIEAIRCTLSIFIMPDSDAARYPRYLGLFAPQPSTVDVKISPPTSSRLSSRRRWKCDNARSSIEMFAPSHNVSHVKMSDEKMQINPTLLASSSTSDNCKINDVRCDVRKEIRRDEIEKSNRRMKIFTSFKSRIALGKVSFEIKKISVKSHTQDKIGSFSHFFYFFSFMS